MQQNFKGCGHHRKVKGQVKVTPWCCTPVLLINVPCGCQRPAPYGFIDTAQTKRKGFKVTSAKLKIKSIYTMTLYIYTPNHCSYQASVRLPQEQCRGSVPI